MPQRIKDQAICIRHLDWSETSQIVVVLSPEHGKLRALAKGSKRTSPGAIARFSGGIELLTMGQIVGILKPTTELMTVTEWDLQDPLRHLRTSLDAQRYALFAADLTHHMLEDRDPHPRVFGALLRCLRDLEQPSHRAAALLAFQWTLLEDCGYKPELENDLTTAAPLPVQSAYTFDARKGGLVSDGAGDAGWKVRRETVELLRDVSHGAPADHTPMETIDRANRLLCAYVRSILDRELPTMSFVLKA